jgi:hypothetical protein
MHAHLPAQTGSTLFTHQQPLGPDIRNSTSDDVLSEFREMYDEREETLFQKRFAEDPAS